MPEVNERTVRIPIPAEEGKHEGHQIRTINISKDEGIKALYCVVDKKVITYLFARNKDWTLESAKVWVNEHQKRLVSVQEVSVDQESDFIKLAFTYSNGEVIQYEPNSPPFILSEQKSIDDVSYQTEHRFRVQDINLFQEKSFKRKQVVEGITSVVGILNENQSELVLEYRFDKGVFDLKQMKDWATEHDLKAILIEEAGKMETEKQADTCVCPDCKKEVKNETKGACNAQRCPSCNSALVDKTEEKTKAEDNAEMSDGLEIVKIDKDRHLVYGVFLVPEKADHDGDVISVDDVEKVAHDFMAEYRAIDEMHKKETIEADIVESCLAWQDGLDFHGKTLSKGTWFGTVKIHDDEVWKKIVNGQYKGFSVRISGVREPISS